MTLRSSSRLRILIVSQYYPPEVHGAIPRSLAVELADRGHEVEVVTTFPNHPFGHLFPGWVQRFGHVEFDASVRVRRVPTVVDHSLRASRRILSYLSFAATALTVSGAARRADVVYVYGAQPTAAIAPMVWRVFFRTPYVLHVQDIWPECVIGSGLLPGGTVRGVARRVLLAWLRRVHGKAARVVAIGEGAARLLIERGALAGRTTSCSNWVTSAPVPTDRRRSSADTRVVYAGSIGPAQGLDIVIRAAGRCQDLDGLRVSIVGDGIHRPALESLAAELGVRNVHFVGSVPRERMPEIYGENDFAIVSLTASPMTEITVPSKLQDLLVNGVPVLGVLNGDAAAMLVEAGAGYIAAPGDVDSVERALRAAHDSTPEQREQLSASGRAYASRVFSISRGVDHIERALAAAALSTTSESPTLAAPEGARS